MFDIWNECDLRKPPILNVPSKDVAFVERLRLVIKRNLAWQVEKNGDLAQTAAILSRLMARRKNSFRRMSGYRIILKLNAALCRLLRVDLTRDLECFYGALPDEVPTGDDFYAELPTRNFCDYVMIRLMVVHRIHQRIRDCCEQAADYFAMVLRENFFLEINTLLLAVFGKLYSLSGLVGNKYVELYSNLLVQRRHFPHHQTSTSEYLPDEFEFPTQIERFHKLEAETSENSNLDVPSLIRTERNLMVPVVCKRQQQKQDMGVAICRRSQPQSPFSIAQLNTVEEVNKFIAKESKQRKKSPKACITKVILDHEWIGALKLFERKVRAGEHKKALNIFRKFLSTNIYL